MVALVKQYGTERILVNSAADWGVSDPLKVPKTVARDARGRHRRGGRSRRIVLGQPDRVLRPERPARRRRPRRRRPAIDQRQLFEGNSVLRGAGAARRSVGRDAAARVVLERRRAHARAARRAHAAPRRARRARARCAPLRTITAGGDLLACSPRSSPGSLPREHGCVGQRLVLPRPRRGLALAAVEPARRAARRSGRRRARRDPAFTCAEAVLVVQHVQHRGPGRSRRGRCTRPTAASSRTSTRSRPSCATS